MEFDQCRKAIERAENLSELTSTLVTLRDQSDVLQLSYQVVRVPAFGKSTPALFLSSNPAWAGNYLKKNYFLCDPLITMARDRALPIDWLTIERHGNETGEFFADMQRHGGGRHGFAVPIRGIAGERALFNITADGTDEFWFRWRFLYLQELCLLAYYFHDRVMEMAGLRSKQKLQRLSPREKQCLQSLVDGLAPNQIAFTQGVSLSAVHACLRTARRKLDCATIEQAVAKVVLLEIVVE